jgi:trehalose synthase
VFGTDVEVRRLCEVAAAHGGIVIDDIVPGHTGKGPDFRLAEMGVGDYPGIYHMVEIPREDWQLLPEVPPGKDSVNLDSQAEDRLQRAGYIVGRLQRVIFQDPGIKDTNWSATAPVTGPDGVERRWVYLHYFKDGQPSINWLDPTFAGMRLVIGDALHALGDLGAAALRLDANGFLGVEKSAEGGAPAWSEGHPLSEAVNQLIAGMVRKVGGFTFQELNLSFDEIKKTAERGADLSYDFVNRPAYAHALVTADTEFLRLTLNAALQHGLQPVRLVHALQNHDELTYELVHFAIGHKDDTFRFRRAELTGGELAIKIRSELIERLTGEAGPYNATFTTNGIASTTATIIAAALGYPDLTNLSPGQVEKIKRAHLLLAMFNAWQPGVVAVSGWDLCGMLTLERSKVPRLLASGDTRWIHRAAYDLMDYRPEARHQPVRIPAATTARPELVRVTAARHSGGPDPPRHRHQCAGGGAGGVRQGHARHGPPARHQTAPGHYAELLQPAHRRQRHVATSGTWRCSDRHGHRSADRRGRPRPHLRRLAGTSSWSVAGDRPGPPQDGQSAEPTTTAPPDHRRGTDHD